MSDDVLVVKRRRHDRKLNTHPLSVGNRNHFAIVTQSDSAGNGFTSLNLIGESPEISIDRSKPLLVYKSPTDPKTANEIVEALQAFKNEIEKEKREIFSKRDYANINSRTIACFKKCFDEKVENKVLIDQNQTLSRRVEQSIGQNSKKNDFSQIFSISNSIQPVFLLESLIQLGHIQRIGVEENGSDENIYEYAVVSTGQTYKTSVKSAEYLLTDENINHPDSNVYKHFRPITNGGRASFGLLRDLINDGMDVGIDPNLEQRSYHSEIRKYIFDEIAPLVDSENLASLDNNLSQSNDGYLMQKASNFSRLPIPVENPQEMNKFIRYLMGRGISGKLCGKMIDSGALMTGHFAKYSKNGEGDSGSNRDYYDQVFFTITDSAHRITGGEKLTLFNESGNYNNTDPAKMKIHKINTHIIQGNSFKLLASEKDVKGTIVGEAVIDAISAYELLGMAGENPDKYNYVSIQGINNFSGFLENNFGIKYRKDSKTKEYIYQHSEPVKDLLPVTSEDIERVRGSFKSKMYYVNDIGNPDNELYLKKINVFKETYGIEFDVINVNDLSDKVYTPEGEACAYTDRKSFDQLMNANGIHINRNLESFTLKRKYIYSDLTPEKVQECKNNIVKIFGGDKVVFAFDNDPAGQMDIKVIHDLKEKFGFDFVDMTPPRYGRNFKPDVNDILKEVIGKNNDESKELLNKTLAPMGVSIAPNIKNENTIKNNFQ